ncbi:L,D-transpeptidase [bacterium]|nr:L,D-transpeptidase [bacterium]
MIKIIALSLSTLTLACAQSLSLPPAIEQAVQKLYSQFEYQDDQSCIVVSITDQRLYLIQNETIIQTYAISTSYIGTGSAAGSNRTPLGVHGIAAKYGANALSGTIFKSRRNTGEIARIYTDSTDVKDDLITSRILWLKGLEAGLNIGSDVDSYQRYIYIHGTNEEGLIGRPASHGCIRMKNFDVIQMYPEVHENTLVIIIK